MDDKRTIKRRHLIYYLKVFDKDSEHIIGFLVDITPHGIMLMSEVPIETGKVFNLKILIQSSLHKREYLNFKAKSLWCRHSINSDFYDTGFELIDTDPKAFGEIESIIDTLGFRD